MGGVGGWGLGGGVEPQDGPLEPQEGPLEPQEGPSGLGLYCTAVQYSAGWRGAKEPTPKNRPRGTPGEAGIFWIAWV